MLAKNYIKLEDAGTLAIEYHGDNLDMNAIAIIQLNLQIIAERVVENMTNRKIGADTRTAFSPGIVGRFEYTLNPAIRLVPTEIRIGSLFEYVIPFIPILADSDIRAAMQGVLGNIIFSIGNSTFNQYFRTNTTGESSGMNSRPIEVGQNVAAIAVVLAQHGQKGITIRHKTPDGRVEEVEIIPNP